MATKKAKKAKKRSKAPVRTKQAVRKARALFKKMREPVRAVSVTLPNTEARILQLEADLSEEKAAHEATKVKLAEALDASGATPRPGDVLSLPHRVASLVQQAQREDTISDANKYLDEVVALCVGAKSGGKDHERGLPRLGFLRENGQQVPDEHERKLVVAALKLKKLVGGVKASEKMNEMGALLRNKPWTASKMTWAEKQASTWNDGAHAGK